MPHPSLVLLASIGAVSGILSGLFGIGGGVLVVPALIYLARFDQHMATGTSLAVLLPPVGLGAALEYYRHGHVNVRAAVVIAVTLFVCAWLTAGVANRINGPHLRVLFGLFLTGLGLSVAYDGVRQFAAR